LCRDGLDRERLLDMEERIRPVRKRAASIMVLAILAAGFWLSWWPLAFVVCILAFFSLTDRLMTRVARPELLAFAAWVGSEAAIALSVVLSGPKGVVALSFLAIPVTTLSTRFSGRGVVAGVAISICMTLAVAFGVDSASVLANPVLVIVPIALPLCVAVLSMPLMESDIKHRSDAVVDRLTGMLNRQALDVRVQELTQQASLTGEPVGVIVGDLDNFKRVNDTLGHATGDVVLREVAYVLRKQLRAFDLAYRLGGEEFLVLLPGAERGEAAELAERLREAVVGERIHEGLSITMSFGVHASARGEAFDYPTVFARADAALYEAKRGGRDRVCVAGEPTLAHAA
jgi:diguanylate cyclase (GGDEF)-like protein